MHSKTLESTSCPGASFTVRPINGPHSLNLHSDRVDYGDAIYNAFRFVCTAWVDAPMLGAQTAPKYDAAVIDLLLPSFVEEAVLRSFDQWQLTEDDTKNS